MSMSALDAEPRKNWNSVLCEFVATFKLPNLYKAKKSLYSQCLSLGGPWEWSQDDLPEKRSWDPDSSKIHLQSPHLDPPCNTNIYLNISFSTSKYNFQFRVINEKTPESDLSVRKNKYDSLPYLLNFDRKNFPYPAYYVWHRALWD